MAYDFPCLLIVDRQTVKKTGVIELLSKSDTLSNEFLKPQEVK